ncbi:MAG: ribosome small subunit-dependent GTPase A [Bacteroidetes bacterium RBG_13_43_22]|nr:MAG: ribosome small subunit-dependent GTPase A [Bacteroidetes bacterium RBG_13_43_22]
MEKGLVIKSTGSRYRILYHDGEVIDCNIKGKFRVKGIRTTNPVAVGDNILFEFEQNSNSGIITEVLQRRNYILRKSSNLSKEYQIIAANIDQAFLMISIIFPETPAEFIDRFLITAEAYRIPAGILINKTDIYGDEEREKMEYYISLYEQIGYECFGLSVVNNTGIESVREKMKDKVSLLAGNSGVGKSSLLNLLNPSLNLKTESVSEYHRQGKHVTTFPEMHRMTFGGFVIDSPGIRGFGVVDMDRNEIYHFFPEIFRISEKCRFYNCLHLDEPGCAVRNAVEEGIIDPLRYRSYINILEDENRKYR